MFKSTFTFVLAATAVSSARASCINGAEEISLRGVECPRLCPDEQEGLGFGSYCDLLETGVYGCKPYSDRDSPASADYDAPLNCTGNIAGGFPVSVEDGDGTFCSAGPVCSGTIAGNCPGVQDGLPSGSVCVVIGTGVYGCVLAPVV
ncbi:hypothetical protein V7S43_017285 [Phytophthora oleae]|uniref:Cysteine-rich protein n=1 Tax=Phytophthora oleae TaxID=2107226 RepID=A0ABD3ETP1_9STRA